MEVGETEERREGITQPRGPKIYLLLIIRLEEWWEGGLVFASLIYIQKMRKHPCIIYYHIK